MRRLWIILPFVLAGMAPTGASAQTAWDSPLLLPPRPAPGLGIFLTDMHGGGIGAMGTWRSSTWNYGFRAGIAEGAAGGLAAFGGIDYTGAVNTASVDFPLDVDWLLGAGIGVADPGAVVSFPVGLTVGYSFQGEGARFTPFATPRVVLDGFFGGTAASGLELDVAVDLGLDLRFTGAGGPFSGSTIRFAGSIGRDAIGIGLVF